MVIQVLKSLEKTLKVTKIWFFVQICRHWLQSSGANRSVIYQVKWGTASSTAPGLGSQCECVLHNPLCSTSWQAPSGGGDVAWLDLQTWRCWVPDGHAPQIYCFLPRGSKRDIAVIFRVFDIVSRPFVVNCYRTIFVLSTVHRNITWPEYTPW